MLYLNDTGFVVKRINFGEADRYITLFTEEHGKIEVVAKGVRKITSRRASYLELLNKVRFLAVKSSKNYILTEVELLDSFEDIKTDLPSVSTVFLICELIDKLCATAQKHEDVFLLIEKIVMNLHEDIQKHALFDFQVELLSKLGFWNNEKTFQNEEDLKQFIENIAERKIKTKIYS